MTLAAKTSFKTVVGAMVAAGLASLPYLQTARFGFVNYDDPSHVAENPVVQQGLTRSGLAWAWGLGGPVPDATWFNWPLAWLSHMADVSLFGSWAGGHHLASVALHAVNAALVVAFVRSLGITAGAAMFCGVVFAVHPVQVEAVAWISERKTLVSGCFMLLALLAYVTAGRRLAGSGQPLAAMSPAAVLAWTALGALALLGKPMAVVLPVLLLLLDFWPLRRWVGRDVRRSAGLLVEKLPLFALALATGLWTIQAQRQAGAVRDLDDIPLPARLANAVCATAEYLGMLVWPVNLAVFYPHPGWRPVWQVLLAAAVLAVISWASWRRRKHEPALLVGWLWFLVTLAPMIGVIQVGNQAIADRYLYLAMLGPLIALVGSQAASACPAPSHPAQARREHAGPWNAAGNAPWAWASVAVAVVCLPLTWRQVGVWRDSQALFSHALAAGHESAVARNNLGLALTESGRPGDALPHLQRAVELRADDADAWFNLGNAQAALRDLPAAVHAFERALFLDPDRCKAWNNLGIVLVLGGDPAAAEAAWRRSLAIRPDFPDARLNLAKLLDSRAEARPGAAGVDEADRGRENDPTPP
jgi:tetratricopeptide (TPR) repeat protein